MTSRSPGSFRADVEASADVIRPPGFNGAAFGEAAEGDLRIDASRRRSVAAALGIPAEWAFASQVHGTAVVHASTPERLGEADAIYTTRPALPVAIATADCVPIVLEGNGFAAVVRPCRLARSLIRGAGGNRCHAGGIRAGCGASRYRPEHRSLLLRSRR